MIGDEFDDEMHALLSAHAMGTLTKAEQARLFEKAIGNQAIFDQLMDEETTRAALASPLVKRVLANTLAKMDEEKQPRPRVNGWLWVAMACSVAVGIVSLAWLRPAAEIEKPVVVAVAQHPPEAAPIAAVPAVKPAASKARAVASEPKETLPERARADAINLPTPAPPAAPAAPAAPAVSSEDRQEVKKLESVANSARDTGASALASGRAQLARAKAQPPVLRVVNRQLILDPVAKGFAYAFVVDGERIRPLFESGANTVEAGVRRTIAIGEASATAELWVLLTPTADPVLERSLSGVLPLPTRPWVKSPVQ